MAVRTQQHSAAMAALLRIFSRTEHRPTVNITSSPSSLPRRPS
jgi:hypothetical protein